MHCKKNICETLLKFLFGDGDTPAVRLDLKGRRLRNHLWIHETFPGSEKFVMPDANYVLSREDRSKFMKTLRSMKMPSRYVSNIREKIEKGKFSGLKSHDYQVIFQ